VSFSEKKRARSVPASAREKVQRRKRDRKDKREIPEREERREILEFPHLKQSLHCTARKRADGPCPFLNEFLKLATISKVAR